MKSSLVGAEGYGRASKLGSEVDLLVGFPSRGPRSGVRSVEGGPIRHSSLSESSG